MEKPSLSQATDSAPPIVGSWKHGFLAAGVGPKRALKFDGGVFFHGKKKERAKQSTQQNQLPPSWWFGFGGPQEKQKKKNNTQHSAWFGSELPIFLQEPRPRIQIHGAPNQKISVCFQGRAKSHTHLPEFQGLGPPNFGVPGFGTSKLEVSTTISTRAPSSGLQSLHLVISFSKVNFHLLKNTSPSWF